MKVAYFVLQIVAYLSDFLIHDLLLEGGYHIVIYEEINEMLGWTDDTRYVVPLLQFSSL